MTELKFKIKKPGNIKDKEVLAQLPSDVVEQLGEQCNTGYDLKYSRREIFFDGGLLEYSPYKNECIVQLGTPEELGLQVVDMTEALEQHQQKESADDAA